MLCPKCASEGTGKFCWSCGSPMPTATPPDSVEDTVLRVGSTHTPDQTYDVSEIPDDGYTVWRTQETNRSGYLAAVREDYPVEGEPAPAGGYYEQGYGSSSEYPPNVYPPAARYEQGYPAQAEAAYVEPGYPEQGYAGEAVTAPLGRRFGAAVLDNVIDSVLIGGVYGVLFGALLWWDTSGQWQLPAVILVLVPSFLVALLLFNRLYRVGARGQTWGKAALQVAVVDRYSGEPIGLGRAVVRALVYLVPLVPLTCFLDRSGELRTWADAAAGSRVVQM